MKRTITKKDHINLWNHVESEGFGYYMLHYGPDLKTIAKLGFDKDELEKACKLLHKVERAIYEAEEFEVEDE